MLVEFDQLPDTARVWIYQAERRFSKEELPRLKTGLEEFLRQWTAHGAELKAAYQLPYDRFIVIGLDQDLNSASGCSIDASVHFIQQIEQEFGLNLLDRMNVTFRQGEYFAYKPLNEFRKMAKSRSVSPKTIVFNNLVTNKYEYQQDWEIAASESWHSRFF